MTITIVGELEWWGRAEPLCVGPSDTCRVNRSRFAFSAIRDVSASVTCVSTAGSKGHVWAIRRPEAPIPRTVDVVLLSSGSVSPDKLHRAYSSIEALLPSGCWGPFRDEVAAIYLALTGLGREFELPEYAVVPRWSPSKRTSHAAYAITRICRAFAIPTWEL